MKKIEFWRWEGWGLNPHAKTEVTNLESTLWAAERRTYGHTDGRTDPLIEMRGRI